MRLARAYKKQTTPIGIFGIKKAPFTGAFSLILHKGEQEIRLLSN